MSTLTEIRTALGEALSELPERVSISLVGGKYDEGLERFVVRILVGEPGQEGEARLDELLADEGDSSVCFLIERDPTLDGVVSAAVVRSHSGHRAYAQPGDEPNQLGTELVVETYH